MQLNYRTHFQYGIIKYCFSFWVQAGYSEFQDRRHQHQVQCNDLVVGYINPTGLLGFLSNIFDWGAWLTPIIGFRFGPVRVAFALFGGRVTGFLIPIVRDSCKTSKLEGAQAVFVPIYFISGRFCKKLNIQPFLLEMQTYNITAIPSYNPLCLHRSEKFPLCHFQYFHLSWNPISPSLSPW